jgi:hypothetical protein
MNQYGVAWPFSKHGLGYGYLANQIVPVSDAARVDFVTISQPDSSVHE